MTQPMILADGWTVWHAIIAGAAIMLAGMSLKKYSEEDKDLYDETI